METGEQTRKTLILAGGGHAHVEVLRQQIIQPSPTLDITLVSPNRQLAYSGMLPATIAGHYRREQMHVDLALLAARASARFIDSALVGVRAASSTLSLANGQTLAYDLLSLNIGSARIQLPADDDAIPTIPVKPVQALWDGIDTLDSVWQSQDRQAQIVVVGGGAGGVELALALAHRWRYWRRPPRLVLCSRSADVLGSHTPAVRGRLQTALTDAGIVIQAGQAAERTTQAGLRLANGQTLAADVVFCATGAVAPGWLADSGLARDPHGFVSVGWDLVSSSHDNILAAGDICSLPEQRPKSGVYAVRQAPVLANNIRRLAGCQPLQPFAAQQRSLALITLGSTQAVASRGWPIAPVGYAIWRIKDRIDRAFMQRYGAG